MKRLACDTWFWPMAVILLLIVFNITACASSGPPALRTLVRPSDLATYQRLIREHGGDAKAAYVAWRAQETGRSAEGLLADDERLSLTENPFSRDDASAVQRGAVIYQAHCIECHGPNADGLGPSGEQLLGTKDFHHSHIRMAVNMSDSYVAGWYTKTSNGSDTGQVMPDGTARAMPAMRDLLTREQIWLALTYLASNDDMANEVSR